MMPPKSVRRNEGNFPTEKAFQADVIRLVVEIKGPSMQGTRWLTDLDDTGTVTLQYELTGKKIVVKNLGEAKTLLSTQEIQA